MYSTPIWGVRTRFLPTGKSQAALTVPSHARLVHEPDEFWPPEVTEERRLSLLLKPAAAVMVRACPLFMGSLQPV